MEDSVRIKIKLDDRIIDGVVWYEYSTEYPEMLVLHIEAGEMAFSACADNCFSALTTVRKDLEKLGAFPLVMGAHERVYPSPMQLGMGDGRKAYLQRMGQPALKGDYVDIFDPCEEQDVSTVEKQEQYHNWWIADATGKYRKRHT